MEAMRYEPQGPGLGKLSPVLQPSLQELDLERPTRVRDPQAEAESRARGRPPHGSAQSQPEVVTR